MDREGGGGLLFSQSPCRRRKADPSQCDLLPLPTGRRKMAEGKALRRRLPFPKTHDLRQLLVLLKDAYPEWISLMDQAMRLSFYSVSTRYPGDSASREDMEQALVDMGAVRDLVRASFGLQ